MSTSYLIAFTSQTDYSLAQSQRALGNGGSKVFSQTAEYALRAVVWLASDETEQRLGVRRIAAGTQVPESYLSKVLQGLARAGLVASRRGVGGGHTLTRPASEITVLEVINAVDPIPRIQGCPLGLASHRGKLCGMHARLDQAMGLVEETLGQSTIADILSTPGRPLPMRELGTRPPE